MGAEVGQIFKNGGLTDPDIAGLFISNLSAKLNTRIKDVPMMFTTQNNVPEAGNSLGICYEIVRDI